MRGSSIQILGAFLRQSNEKPFKLWPRTASNDDPFARGGNGSLGDGLEAQPFGFHTASGLSRLVRLPDQSQDAYANTRRDLMGTFLPTKIICSWPLFILFLTSDICRAPSGVLNLA